ncbi:MAG: 3-dehydroquinate synthase [Chloroflexota bacterium]|nr:3-dehydroquinate synthase [Chloroflexota bacterium]
MSHAFSLLIGNIVLTGFMGTGKTSVGRQVARRTGRAFVDMDTEIEARAGKSLPRIFAEDGEGMFRRMEAALCEELSAQQGLVIATGGGALVDPINRARMRSGTIVCLTCDVDEIMQRVSEDNSDRPLLNVGHPRAEIERLLELRREAYRAIPWQIDTTDLSVEEVAVRVVGIAGVITLLVRYPGGQYPIHSGDGLLVHIGGMLGAAGVPEGSRIAVVSNPVVSPLYGAQVEAALRSAGFQPCACSIPDGELHKTPATIAALYDQFLANELDRSGTVLSLGGGVTGDLAGFAAATFMRGLRFVQVPTTLLAMVDASVGAKTGVDLPQGKNLVGAFKQPALVVVDPAVLATLPAEEIHSGMAEVIKHGIIGAPDLFAELERRGEGKGTRSQGDWVVWIAHSLRVKIAIVEQDPFEQGRRAALNLGHTVGHALERLSGFSLRHGEAVSIGMVAAARIAVELGQAGLLLAPRIEAALAAWGLPVRCPPFDANAIWKAMAHDKKRRGRSLRWVLPHALGDVEITEGVPQETVMSVLRDLGAR